MDFIKGEILYIDKPLNWTSFRLVKVVRGKLREKLKLKKLKEIYTTTFWICSW